jgi:hypothetical protein
MVEAQTLADNEEVYRFSTESSAAFFSLSNGFRTLSWNDLRQSQSAPISLGEEDIGAEAALSSLARTFQVVNTSVIPDEAEIVSAAYYVSPTTLECGRDSQDINVNRYCYLAFVEAGTSVDPTNITESDFGNFTANILSDQKLAWNDPQPVVIDNVYKRFPLNALGVSRVNKTGYMLIGALAGFDLENVDPGMENLSKNFFASSLSPEEQKHPLLEVIVRFPIVPAASTDLEVNNTINATDVHTAKPKFSATFQDASSTALASFFQIQVTKTPSDWTALYWDSEKQPMNKTLSPGERSKELMPSINFVSDGTAYYWRIRYWDQYGNTGKWSTENAFFVMSNNSEKKKP